LSQSQTHFRPLRRTATSAIGFLEPEAEKKKTTTKDNKSNNDNKNNNKNNNKCNITVEKIGPPTNWNDIIASSNCIFRMKRIKMHVVDSKRLLNFI
jgi:hypothetical protein